MVDQPLFEIQKESLETGMRGYPVGYCITSSVDPYKGLFYCGRPVAHLASKKPEEVIFLLWYGRDPKDLAELQEFERELKSRSQLPPGLKEQIFLLPRSGHPMKMLCTSLLLNAMLDSNCGNYFEDTLNLIARIPQITAHIINHHAGWGQTPSLQEGLGYIEQFVHLLNIPNKREKELIDVMKLFNILHYDHGGGNLSCFTGKAVASGLEDAYGCLCAAMAALAGPRHGKANQDCLDFVKEIYEQLGDEADIDSVEKLLLRRLENKELIFGFGHAVLRVEDPRATVQYEWAQKQYPQHPLVKTALLLRQAGPRVLGQNPKISNPFPNVDAISGSLLTASGFEYPEYYTVLFGMSRIVGIGIQIVYERILARQGRGTPIIRPKYLYRERSCEEAEKMRITKVLAEKK